MLCAGGSQVDACGFDAAVAQQVSQFGNVPAGSVEDSGKQVPQIVRKHFPWLHACVLAQPFQFRPDLSAAKFLSAFGAKDRAGGGFLFFHILQQLATEFSGEQDGADLAFESDFCFALLDSFYGDIRYFADPDAGGSNGLHQKSQPFLSQFVGRVQKTLVVILRQLTVGIPKQTALDF